MDRRSLVKTLARSVALLGFASVLSTPTKVKAQKEPEAISVRFLGRASVVAGEVNFYASDGLSDVTAEVFDGNICRFRHSAFRGRIYALGTFVEQLDREATLMAADGTGIVDVYCYNTEGQRQNDYHFQIVIEAYTNA